MKEFVSHRRVMILAAAASLSILWAVLVVPSGPPWIAMATLAAVTLLLVSTVVLGLRTAQPTSLETVIRSVETEKPRRKS